MLRCAEPGCGAEVETESEASVEGWSLDAPEWWCPGCSTVGGWMETYEPAEGVWWMVETTPVALRAWRCDQLGERAASIGESPVTAALLQALKVPGRDVKRGTIIAALKSLPRPRYSIKNGAMVRLSLAGRTLDAAVARTVLPLLEKEDGALVAVAVGVVGESPAVIVRGPSWVWAGAVMDVGDDVRPVLTVCEDTR
jgi:hypothetical protein